jgi:hypothetical protein
MDDPELHDDETLLVRTKGIFVKSIPFEGILTDKRIILVDRAKNLLPPKEILLAAIKDLLPGENAIRDQTITLSVLAQNKAVRQVILTFSRATGGNRTKERDEWVQLIRKYRATSLGQTIRKSISGTEPVPIKKDGTKPVKIEIVSSQRIYPQPAMGEKPVTSPGAVRQERPQPVSPPVPVPPLVSFGTYCTRCGNRVPDGSLFCNRCGTKIIIPVDAPPVPAVPQPTSPAQASASPAAPQIEIPIDQDTPSGEPLVESPPVNISRDPLRDSTSGQRTASIRIIPGTPLPEPLPDVSPPLPSSKVPVPDAASKQKPARRFLPRLFSPKTPPPAPLLDSSQLPLPYQVPEPATAPKQKPARRFLSGLFSSKTPPLTPPAPARKSRADPPQPRKTSGGKKKIIAIGIAVILVIAITAGIFLFARPAYGTSSNVTATPSGTPTPTETVTAAPAVGSTVTIPHAETTAPTIPSTGVYVHVNYIGGWKGTYGPSNALQPMTSSGDRLVNVENATGVIQASFAKQDGSSHEILVEIYKDGKMLTKGVTSVPNGKVALSVDTTTGIAQAPVITGA